jgi:integral membrane protein
MLNSAIGRLRAVSFVEGISTLLLFLVAMPLKYAAGRPEMVTIVGRIHGGLVIAFCIALFMVMRAKGWTMMRPTLLFIASLFPFGFIWIERELRRVEAIERSRP